MSSPSWENLDDFLDPADFAVPGTIHFQDGATRTVNGIFDNPQMNAQLGEYDFSRQDPRFLIKEADGAGVNKRDTLVVEGVTYDIVAPPLLTGDGMAQLRLAQRP